MRNKIEIIKINYFGNEVTGSEQWNAKVLYMRNNILNHCMIDIDFWAKEIYINKNIQAKECKFYSGLLIELRNLNYFNQKQLKLK